MKTFQKFDSAATALEEVAALLEGKVTPRLASLLDPIKNEKKVSLAVADPKLGNAISKLPGLEVKAIADSSTQDLYRAIRSHLPSLIPGLMPDDVNTMSLGLSHSLARHKLKFSPDKIDTMIVQAIALLDDLDKELNIYAMRVKEWYGWHFPEMAKMLNDNLAYARVVLKMGMRSNWDGCDLTEILPEEIAGAVKSAADRSMGTEITQEDLDNIQLLAEQVVSFTEYRQQLAAYLSARMVAIAPNLTVLVGELVGARLIAHAGSLMNLSKSPASTIQILGAEKALFRALKTKHDTPKYGLIYHASLVGQASGKNKGKMARILAAKAAIGLRVDALQDWGENEAEIPEEEKAALGLAARANLERKLGAMEGKQLKARGVAIAPNGVMAPPQPKKWDIKEARKYNPDADALTGEEMPALEADKNDSRQKGKMERKEKKAPLIEEMPDTSDRSATAEADPAADESQAQPDGRAGHSDTIPTPSEDTPPPANTLTATKHARPSTTETESGEAKKARKLERRLRKDQEARQLERNERRVAKEAQNERRSRSEANSDEAKYADAASKCGLSVVRYVRKLSRGEIRFQSDGTPVAISKKDIKKQRKKQEQQQEEHQLEDETSLPAASESHKSKSKKRKRPVEVVDEQGEEAGDTVVPSEVDGDRKERKKKKKSKMAS